jgi:hypothetical protein
MERAGRGAIQKRPAEIPYLTPHSIRQRKRWSKEGVAFWNGRRHHFVKVPSGRFRTRNRVNARWNHCAEEWLAMSSFTTPPNEGKYRESSQAMEITGNPPSLDPRISVELRTGNGSFSMARRTMRITANQHGLVAVGSSKRRVPFDLRRRKSMES